MVDFKKLLGDKFKEGMTAEEQIALLSQLNLADLGSGEYVAKGKFDAKDQELAKLSKLIAEFQEKERASLTEQQKKDLEYKELIDSEKTLKEKVAEYELKERIMQTGYSADECNKIVEARKKGESEAKVYAEIMQSRIEDAVKNAKAESQKNGTPPPPAGGENPPNDDDENLKLIKGIAEANLDDPKGIEKIKGDYLMGQDE